MANPNGVEIYFYDKAGTKQIRKSVKGKGLLHSLHRTGRRNKPDPIAQDYSLGSVDWLTDVMIADNEDELQKMPPSSTGACLTSTCSRMVRVQWSVKSASGEVDSGRMDNCVTLAVVNTGDENAGERLPTKEIYVFPEGTKIEDTPFWGRWSGIIDYLQSLHVKVDSRP